MDSFTPAALLMTRETVPRPTPARAATSSSVGVSGRCLPMTTSPQEITDITGRGSGDKGGFAAGVSQGRGEPGRPVFRRAFPQAGARRPHLAPPTASAHGVRAPLRRGKGPSRDRLPLRA
ncbi:hypothetical protein GCM10018783_18050 [Streptomyces griseosporeus]|nr:hypothetical protein GCM10018783_18050 [Streptomyces griseosporeus]